MCYKHCLFLIAIIFNAINALATDRVSATSGNWGTAGTWSPSGIPVAGDNITISSGHIVSMNANGSCNNLTVNGNANWTANRTVNVGGNITINNGGSLTGGSTGGYNVTGTLTVPAGATATLGRTDITITGVSTISGTLIINNSTGAKTFANVTISSGGTWNPTAAEDFTINGNFINNGTFTANTGAYTMAGAGKSLSGTSTIIFNDVSFTGTYTNNGTVQINSNFGGGGTLTQGANSTLVIGDPTPAGNLTATASGNTVRYLISTGNQSSVVASYSSLIFENTGSGTIDGTGIYTVTGNIDVVGGIVDLSRVTLSGNLNIASGATVNLRGSPVISGTANINGQLNITGTPGTKIFNNITISSTGTWNSAVAENFTINGSLSCSGTFTSNTGIYTLAGSGKTISGTLSISKISCTGSYTNNAALTVGTSLTGAGTFSQGSTGTLNIAATAANFSVTGFNASASGNTVNYTLAGAQSVKVPADLSYHHLSLAGTGNKTLLGATDINGNLTISSVLVANNFNITLGGNWSSTGTFTPGTNTVTVDGAGAQSITRSGGETFNHLAIAGSGTKSLGSAITTTGNLTISSVLDVTASNFGVAVRGNWSNNGTFTSQAGTVTFNGTAAQTIGGTSITNFYDLTQNNAAGVSLTQAQNLINALTISSGTFTTTGFNFTLLSTASGTAHVAAIPGGADFTGNLIMQRYTGTGPTDWRLLASPISGATIAQWADDFATSGFTGSTDPSNSFVSIYSYDETQPGDLDLYGYVPATNVTNSISNGKGFWAYLGPTPVTFEVVGSPNKFAQSPAVTYTNSGNISFDGWNLISNPYPSAIDWNSANWTKTNVDGAIYIYNSYTGSYASYVGGVGVNGGSNFIPSSQAFWVKTNAGSPVLSVVENVKTSSDNTFMKAIVTPNTSHYPMVFRDFPIPLNTNSNPNSVKLTVSRNGREDETYIQFKQGATNDFNTDYDAWKLLNLDPSLPNLSSVINDTSDLSINCLQDLTGDVSVKIRLTVPVTGTYTIRRDSILMLPSSSCIFLEDLLNGNMIDLRTAVSYSFSISDTTKLPRFILHIYAPISKQAVPSSCTYDSTGIAIATGTGAGPWDYLWMNANGDTLQTSVNLSTGDTLSNIPAGIYTVNVSGSACGTVADTIEIKSTSTLSVMANYSDVTCFGLNDGSAYSTVTGGIIPCTYLWSNGDTSSAISNLTPGTYSITVTDGAGCVQTQWVTIQEPLALAAGFVTSTDTVDLSTNNSAVFTDTSAGATLYSWNFGDTTLLDSAQNPVHYFSYAGTYTVTLIISNGNCFDTAYSVIWVLDSVVNTGVSEAAGHASWVQVVYGAEDISLSFNLPERTDIRIHLYNSIGEEMLSQEIKQVRKNKVRLAVNDFPAGIYVAVTDLNDALISRKIIVTSR